MNTAPCKACDKRELGCHAGCGAYKEFKAELEKLRKHIQVQRIKEREDEYRLSYFRKERK